MSGSGNKKRKSLGDLPDNPCEIVSITPSVTPHTSNKTKKPSGKFDVTYKVALSCKCCSNHNKDRLSIGGRFEFLADRPVDYSVMMDKTITKIKEHKKSGTVDRHIETCRLDFEAGLGEYYMLGSKSPFLWEGLWAIVENKVNEFKVDAAARSGIVQKKYDTIADSLKEKAWEKGGGFKHKHEKKRAIRGVMDSLEKHSDKSVTKATVLLGALVERVASSELFDQNNILTDHLKKRNKTMEDMFNNARKCIVGLKGSSEARGRTMNDRSIKILTGLAAIFVGGELEDDNCKYDCSIFLPLHIVSHARVPLSYS